MKNFKTINELNKLKAKITQIGKEHLSSLEKTIPLSELIKEAEIFANIEYSIDTAISKLKREKLVRLKINI